MWFKKKRYKVTLTGRAGLIYTEGDHVAKINSEFLNGEFNYVVGFSRFDAWEPPYQDEPISESDLQRIRENIRKDLEVFGSKIAWD